MEKSLKCHELSLFTTDIIPYLCMRPCAKVYPQACSLLKRKELVQTIQSVAEGTLCFQNEQPNVRRYFRHDLCCLQESCLPNILQATLCFLYVQHHVVVMLILNLWKDNCLELILLVPLKNI